jgi:hypothetical protein
MKGGGEAAYIPILRDGVGPDVLSCPDGSWLIKLSHLTELGAKFELKETGNLLIHLTSDLRYIGICIDIRINFLLPCLKAPQTKFCGRKA